MIRWFSGYPKLPGGVMLLLLLPIVVYAGYGVRWERHWAGAGRYTDSITAVATDASYNAYVTGAGSRTGEALDIVTAKYNQNGVEQWRNYYSGGRHLDDAAVAIAVDVSNNVYVCGTSREADNRNYLTVISYNSIGGLRWRWTWRPNTPGTGDPSEEGATGMVFDARNNRLYVCGTFQTQTGDVSTDYLVVRLNPATGDTVWTARYNGGATGGDDGAVAIALGDTGIAREPVIAGYYYDVGYSQLHWAIIRLNAANGTLRWQRKLFWYTDDDEQPTGICSDTNGNIYVTGWRYDAAGTYTRFMTLKLRPDNSSFDTIPSVGNTAGDAWGVACKYDSGAVYVIGSFQDWVSSSPPSNEDWGVFCIDTNSTPSRTLNVRWRRFFDGGNRSFDRATGAERKFRISSAELRKAESSLPLEFSAAQPLGPEYEFSLPEPRTTSYEKNLQRRKPNDRRPPTRTDQGPGTYDMEAPTCLDFDRQHRLYVAGYMYWIDGEQYWHIRRFSGNPPDTTVAIWYRRDISDTRPYGIAVRDTDHIYVGGYTSIYNRPPVPDTGWNEDQTLVRFGSGTLSVVLDSVRWIYMDTLLRTAVKVRADTDTVGFHNHQMRAYYHNDGTLSAAPYFRQYSFYFNPDSAKWIWGLYDEVHALSVDAGQLDSITFMRRSPWEWLGTSRRHMKCTLALFGNTTTDSTVRTDSTWLIAISAAVCTIYTPIGTITGGETIPPRVRVANLSTQRENLPVRFTISNVYNQLQYVPLNSMETTNVVFPDWVAAPAGNHLVKCTVGLFADCWPPDNKKSHTITVVMPDAQAIRINAPTGTVNPGTPITPSATVKNVGSTRVRFWVKLDIEGGYSSSVRTANLQPGDTQRLNFAQWTANPTGLLQVKCSTQLTGDLNPGNDKVTGTVLVRRNDVQTVAIVAPSGNVPQGANITPTATIRSNWDSQLIFNVKFDIIGAGYSATRACTLQAGQTRDITFPNWNASTLGTYTTKCSTQYAGDVDPSNDRVTGSVTVQSGSDVQTVAIIAPTGIVNSNQVITPQASLRNNGPVQAIFDARFTIAGGYTSTRRCTLAASETRTFSFANWTAAPLGKLATRCSTMLTGDINPANDAVSDSVFVRNLDVQTLAILAPTGSVNQGTVLTPMANVRNLGNVPATFDVRFEIQGGYTSTINVSNLAPGDTRVVSFAEWQANPVGNLAVKCTTMLTGDLAPANDRLTGTVNVLAVDVQTVAILAPSGTVNNGAFITPRAKVRNNGGAPATFDVKFDITGGYTSTRSVANLAPGDSATVNFASWTAGPPGNLTVQCSTRLTGDMNTANDRLTASIFVQNLDVTTLSIDAPAGALDSGTSITPQATVRNNGNVVAIFPVRFTITDGYSSTRACTLNPAQSATCSFASWTATRRGSYIARCTTLLAGDLVPLNDWQDTTVMVMVHDVAAAAILAPSGSLLPGAVTPRVLVRNLGTSREPVSATFTIPAAGYSETVELPAGLPVGADTVLDFPLWNATAGIYQTRCSLYLATEQVPANNVVAGSCVVGNLDVGVIAITSPVGMLDTIVEITPSAVVKNFGDFSTDFRVFFRIDGPVTWTDSTVITNLGSGATATATFTPWPKPHLLGDYTTRCSTALTGDTNYANDVQTGSFTLGALPLGWTQKASVPAGPKNKNVKDGGCLAFCPADTPYVYALKGNSRLEFYQYNIADNIWLTKESIPAIGISGKKKTVKKGASMTQLNGRIYAFKGNNSLEFWRYEPGATSYPWTQLPDVPSGAKTIREGSGSAAVQIGDTEYVYLLKGSGTYEFYRYNITAGLWETMAPAPAGTSGKAYKNGSCITYDGNNLIYALKATYNELAAYDIAGNTWTTRAPMPFFGTSGRKKKVKDGGALTAYHGLIYALKGNNTQEFWQYEADSDRWTQKENMPLGSGKRVKGGGALAAADDRLFALKGNNTLEYWQYVPAGVLPAASGFAVLGSQLVMPRAFSLNIVPNPFSRAAMVELSLPTPGSISLSLYDITGRQVLVLASGDYPAGSYRLPITSDRLASGIYLLRLKTGAVTVTRKLIVE